MQNINIGPEQKEGNKECVIQKREIKLQSSGRQPKNIGKANDKNIGPATWKHQVPKLNIYNK